MNKLILGLVCLISLPLFAQDEAPLELETKDEVVTNPLDNLNQPAVETTDLPEEIKTEEEFVAPAVPGAVKPVAEDTRPSPVFTMKAEVEDKKRFNPRASHWVTTFGFETSKYEVIPEKKFEFEGEKKNFRNEQQELWGGRIGFGGEVYLGAGFVTRSMLEGYYMGTLFSRILNGGDEAEDIEFAYTKRTGQILGGDAAQSLGWMFDLKTKNPFMDEMTYLIVEPYIEAGIGLGWAYQNINHSYDTTAPASPGGVAERYKLRVRDDLLNARIGGGINLTSSTGFFLNLRATINRFEVTKRNIDGFKTQSGSTTVFDETNKNAKIDPIVIYTLGGGYKF